MAANQLVSGRELCRLRSDWLAVWRVTSSAVSPLRAVSLGSSPNEQPALFCLPPWGDATGTEDVHPSTHRTMTTIQETKELFRRADAVCFDVDSTVIKEEGIDELAIFCGVGDAVREMTLKAMGGSMTFKKALTERLSIIRCSREQVNKLITDHPPQLTPGIKELVDRLHERNIKVFLISGGFRCIVEHVASQLNIPLHHVYANRLKFYFNGEYAGFDESQPTAESGGKGKVISMLKEQNGFKTVVMIGDGATDLEACPPAVLYQIHVETLGRPLQNVAITSCQTLTKD
ncbi:hypothetical protein GOODEAATRI_026372 [Goodea atripinnis]|uniref:Phosphoserine phosphatase n=1 Tax=Goodea atripinnis TaxID=208336 RepID=A0ABV0Q182_9TELE